VSTAQLRQLSEATRIDLVLYRESHVHERVRRALAREGVAGLGALVKVLRRDEEARTRFRRSLAVSVSGLFRDPEQFELLERELLPTLAENGRRISVWSAGCADGSELYSVALLLERLGLLERSFLLGTDLLAENLALARRGVYEGAAMPEHIRARVRWEERDLLGLDARPGAFRLVLCRNMAIYLAPAAKDELHRRLAGVLAQGGVLLLGRSERLISPQSLGLAPAGPHAYRKVAR
jgi:chemotaxis protein methyltransferase CheR